MSQRSSRDLETHLGRKTALYAVHESRGAKFVAFAGYAMPVEYSTGIKQEHLHTRSAAGLFDISHMGQIAIRGTSAVRLLETLVPSVISSLEPYQQRYTVLTNANGGIIDDVMITRMPDGVLVVANAAMKEAVVAHLAAALEPGCSVELLGCKALIALQGPAAVAALSVLNPAVAKLRFMRAGEFPIAGCPCLVHRCGYTGEDGFELSVASEDAEKIARALLQLEPVAPVGLGARDSLRLEAGLCLSGQDFDAQTTPIEAALDWVVKQREPRFPGAATIFAQMRDGVRRRRVGIVPVGKGPVRAGTALLDVDGIQIGRVTSGGYGPSIAGPVAMGYVAPEHAVPGSELAAVVRGRSRELRVAKLPFVAHRYFK